MKNTKEYLDIRLYNGKLNNLVFGTRRIDRSKYTQRGNRPPPVHGAYCFDSHPCNKASPPRFNNKEVIKD